MQDFVQSISRQVFNISDKISSFRLKLQSIKIKLRPKTITKKSIKNNQPRVSKRKTNKNKNQNKIVPQVQQPIDKFPSIFLESENMKEDDICKQADFSLDDIEISEVLCEDNKQEKDFHWFEFYQSEKERLNKIDPTASTSDIARFAESQWNKMTEEEKLQWKKSNHKKKQGKNFQKKERIEEDLSKSQREKLFQTRFEDFLTKKKQRQKQSGHFPSKLKQEKLQHIVSQKVSASSLIEALGKDKQKNQNYDTLTGDQKLKKIFTNFQL